MAKEYDVAVVGATGAVGETMLAILEQRAFPVRHIYPLASERSAGKKIQFRGKHVTIGNLAEFDFNKAQIGLFSAGGSLSREYAPRAAAAGCVVIDNTSEFRQAENVPLVIPEVNPERIADHVNRGIIANPNCSTIQMLVALKPLHDHATLERINVATYQAVSGSGASAIRELADQTTRLLNGRPIEEPTAYPKQIAFNALPHIDVFQDNGYTREEMKMVWETRKILAAPRAADQSHRGARAGVLRPFGSRAYRNPRQAVLRQGNRTAQRRTRRHRARYARSRRLRHRGHRRRHPRRRLRIAYPRRYFLR